MESVRYCCRPTPEREYNVVDCRVVRYKYIDHSEQHPQRSTTYTGAGPLNYSFSVLISLVTGNRRCVHHPVTPVTKPKRKIRFTVLYEVPILKPRGTRLQRRKKAANAV